MRSPVITHLRSLRFTRRDLLLALAGGTVVALVVILLSSFGSLQTPVPYQGRGITAKWVPATVKYWSKPIDAMAQKYNLDPNLIAIIMTMESGGDPKAVSSADAQGLMQITPLTAKDIASKYLKQPVSHYNLADPQTNIEFGVAYLAYLRGVFADPTQSPSWNSTVELIAAGYNGGPGAAGSLYNGLGLMDSQTVVYSRDAFNMWRERFAADSPTLNRWEERGGSLLISAAQADEK